MSLVKPQQAGGLGADLAGRAWSGATGVAVVLVRRQWWRWLTEQ